MEPIRFGIVGGGWRADFFLRAAQELPERFQVTGLLVRDPAKGQVLEAKWGWPTYRTLDELLQAAPLFVVVSVPWAVTPVMLQELASRNMPALAETPPGPGVKGLVAVNRLVRAGAKIQVAEQYHLQPLHAARLALAASGKLGRITQAQVSAAHGYHGVSLIRRFLRVWCEETKITAHRFETPILAGPGREGPPKEEKTVQSGQTIAYLDFGDRVGVFDFTGDQYFSWVRSNRVLVRGERGEIHDTRVRYLQDYLTPVTLDLVRQDAGETGNLEGFYHKGFLAGAEWVYRNPFIPGRLTDDEIAVASCLQKMAEYVEGGPDFYSVAEASQDHYLGMMIDQAARSGQPVTTTPQEWADGDKKTI